jgi:nuclease S1
MPAMRTTGETTPSSFRLGRGSNLHALWDTSLIQHWPGGAASLRAAVEGETTVIDTASPPAVWAEESCRVVEAAGFYPAGHKLDDEYAQPWSGTLVRRLAAAARRLAAVLNRRLVRQ